MAKKVLSVLPVLFFSLALVSCDIINPAEDVPAYLRVENFTLQTDSFTQGTASNKIVDAWLYVDNDPLSAYELPVSIPVLAEGSHEIKLRAGIIVNGIAATRVYYPFYQFHTETVNLVPGSITQINPVVSYYPATVFSVNENFNGAGTVFTSTPQSDTSLQIVSDTNSFEAQSAKVVLDSQHLLFECATVDSIPLPSDGSPVYMEINYKTNTEFTVGVFAITGFQIFPQPLLVLRATEEWNKVYINLADATTLYSTALGFKPYIRMERNSSVEDAELYFDNIKVVHF
jgi:hypothetical protein